MSRRTDEINFYDDYWSRRGERLNAHELTRLGEIWRTLAMLGSEHIRRPDLEICDLGCGTGWLSNELTKFGSVTGVDVSPSGIELARVRWPTVKRFEAVDILDWEPNQRFDLVISSEVFEHVENKVGFVGKAASLLKPEGYVLVTTPNLRLKRAWDLGSQGAQYQELWASPRALRKLFEAEFTTLHHTTFMFDALYSGLFRYTSAPKILRMLRAIGALAMYDGIRATFGLGLYQIYLGKLSEPQDLA